MTRLRTWRVACVLFVLCAATAIAPRAQTLQTLIKLNPANGTNPADALIQGIDANLYGTMSRGGVSTSCCGTVVQIHPSGELVNLDFKRGAGSTPLANLVLATDGNFYGTTGDGGANNLGEVFKVSPQGKITTLYSFCAQANCPDGASPFGGLVEGRDGNLYGTTSAGGDVTCKDSNPGGCGTAFRVTPHGALTTLHAFTGPEGAVPYAGMILASDGNSFYGTTLWGGTSSFCQASFGCGTVFKMTPSGQLATIYNFCSQPNCTDGQYIYAPLMEGADGNFYGATNAGGQSAFGLPEGCGTLFQLTSSGSLTTLYTFNSTTDGARPNAVVQGTDGNFYGTTSLGDAGNGTIFVMTPSGGLQYQHGFVGGDGANPAGGLLQATNGIFYGTTIAGGSYKSDCNTGGYEGCGTVFTLNMGLRPFVSLVRNPAKVGQTFGILGQGFTGTTSVSLNGTSAAFAVVSDTLMRATVPPGATTGYVTVTTPSGTLTSNVPFHVIP